MNNKSHQVKVAKNLKKATYIKPVLTRYGTVSALTTGATGMYGEQAGNAKRPTLDVG